MALHSGSLLSVLSSGHLRVAARGKGKRKGEGARARRKKQIDCAYVHRKRVGDLYDNDSFKSSYWRTYVSDVQGEVCEYVPGG